MSDCLGCGGLLTGRQKKWCSASCSKQEGRRKHLWDRYQITPEQWDIILEFQGGVCAVCKREPTETRKLCVDHEHGGIVRGLICNYPCNLQIIRKHKKPDLLQNAADYLRNPPAVQALGMAITAPPVVRKERTPSRRQRRGGR